MNANFSAFKTALETASGINAGAIGVDKLNVSGTAADGKVLKLSSGALSWADDGLTLPYVRILRPADVVSPIPIIFGLFSSDPSATAIAGEGKYGIEGDSNSNSGAGVLARNHTGGPALEINGPIKVTSSLTGNAPAFIYTVPTPNTATIVCVNNPLTNNDPNAMLSVTPVFAGTYFPDPWGIYYSTSSNQWCIFNQKNGSGGAAAFPAGMKFNILVIKQ